MKFSRKQERVFVFGALAILILAGGIFWYRTTVTFSEAVAPLVSASGRGVVYELVKEDCYGGIRGECLVLLSYLKEDASTSTVRIADDIADLYVAAGGKARRLELGYVDAAAKRFYFEEVFASKQKRSLYVYDNNDHSWSKLSGWQHDPFLGDRSAPLGRYYVRAAKDGLSVELFDVVTTSSSTPFKLANSEETLWATDCGSGGEPEPRLQWQNDSTLTIDVFAAKKDSAQACAGAFLRTVTLVVE